MNEVIAQALQHDRTIDITTIGRKSGQPRRIEIWFHKVDNRLFITGSPGHRDWYANLVAQPRFTFHLKESVQADLPATAVPITDEMQRQEILSAILQKLGRSHDLAAWMPASPLVEVKLQQPG